MPGIIDQLKKDISRSPLLVAALALIAVALASLDYMEIASATYALTTSLPFQLVHSVHDLFFVTMSLAVAWRLSSALAGMLIALFLLVSLPYHAMQMPHDLPELALALFASAAGIIGIGFLRKRRLAEQQASSPKNQVKTKVSRANQPRKYVRRRATPAAGVTEGIVDCTSCINAEIGNDGVKCLLDNPRVSDSGCSQYGPGKVSGEKPGGPQTSTTP